VKRHFQQDRSPVRLAAYYFCKHNDKDRNDPRRVVATLAYWLAMALPEYKRLLQRDLAVQTDINR
jgi:hypothetical protein